MATFAVDSEGKRIKTDILVSGYVRNMGKNYELLIPEPIKDMCFLFWLIKVCDEWDKESSSKGIKIDGQIVVKTGSTTQSIYGRESISTGSYSWQIKFKTHIEWFCFGIIEDKTETLKKYTDDHVYGHNPNGDGCFLFCSGEFWIKDVESEYCHALGDKDTVITMTLNMDKHSISYKINDEDFGSAIDSLDKSKYRMVLSLYYKDESVELL